MARQDTLTLRPLSTLLGRAIRQSAMVSIRNPIEMVVAVLLLASFSYFTLLARTSDILSGTSNTQQRLYPTTVVYPTSSSSSSMTLNHSSIQKHSLENALRVHLIQIAVSDPSHNSTSMARFKHAIMHQIAVPDDDYAEHQFSYSHDLCYQPFGSNHGCSELSSPTTMRDNDSTKVTLWYAVDGTSSFRRDLVRQWTHKIQQLPPIGNLLSQDNQEKKENVLAWAFTIIRNVVLRIHELIEVSVCWFIYSFFYT